MQAQHFLKALNHKCATIVANANMLFSAKEFPPPRRDQPCLLEEQPQRREKGLAGIPPWPQVASSNYLGSCTSPKALEWKMSSLLIQPGWFILAFHWSETLTHYSLIFFEQAGKIDSVLHRLWKSTQSWHSWETLPRVKQGTVDIPKLVCACIKDPLILLKSPFLRRLCLRLKTEADGVLQRVACGHLTKVSQRVTGSEVMEGVLLSSVVSLISLWTLLHQDCMLNEALNSWRDCWEETKRCLPTLLFKTPVGLYSIVCVNVIL